MTYLTDHLTKLTCAARAAHDHGYVHTGKVLEQLIVQEERRILSAAPRGLQSITTLENGDALAWDVSEQ